MAHEQLYAVRGSDHSPARLALAEAAVQAATRLRPDAAETHLARAQYLYFGRRDYAGALAELEIARRALPNDPRLFELTGYILRRRGQQEEGLQNLERAVELDPRNFYTLQQIARLKGFLLAVLLGLPLLALVLKLIEWTGPNWWIWAAAVVIAFQLLLLLIAPAVIMPLFNKFTPLPQGSLRERLFALAQRTEFPTRSIEVMDGSKRSRHSNAFFTGFGRFRKIILFDTLVAQLAEPELESVLAHEIGHYKKRHVVKLLGVSIAGVLIGFAAVAWLARQQWFYRAFGFEYHAGFVAANVVPAMLLFALLAGTIGFWFRRWFTSGRAVSNTRRMRSPAPRWATPNRLSKHCAN